MFGTFTDQSLVHIDQSLVISISGNGNDCSLNKKKEIHHLLSGMGG